MLGQREGVRLDDTYDVTEYDVSGKKKLIGYVKARKIGNPTGSGEGMPSYAEKVKEKKGFVGGELLSVFRRDGDRGGCGGQIGVQVWFLSGKPSPRHCLVCLVERQLQAAGIDDTSSPGRPAIKRACQKVTIGF